MNRIERPTSGGFELDTFGGVPMGRIAVARIDLNAAGSLACRQVRLDRRAVFAYDVGRTIYELADPEGSHYVMQASCVAEDPTLDEESLGALGGRLQVPAGWRFSARLLDEPLEVDTRHMDAAAVQDDLENTYCRYR